jgi:hypothetical protein
MLVRPPSNVSNIPDQTQNKREVSQSQFGSSSNTSIQQLSEEDMYQVALIAKNRGIDRSQAISIYLQQKQQSGYR